MVYLSTEDLKSARVLAALIDSGRVPKADGTWIERMTVTVHPRVWDKEVESAMGSCEGFQVQLWGLNVIMDGFIEHGDLELGSSFLKGGPT